MRIGLQPLPFAEVLRVCNSNREIEVSDLISHEEGEKCEKCGKRKSLENIEKNTKIWENYIAKF